MGGFKVATIRGIPIRIHFTFLLVLPLLAYAFSRAFVEAAQAADVPPERIAGNPLVWGFGLALGLFLSVLLHELAHSLYAIRKGGRVHDITLLMIGGVSHISEMPKRARDEAIMALVGPLTSIGLGVLLYGLHVALAGTPSFALRFGLFYLGGLNLFLGVFNLLPAFPMDGGRVLRAALTPRLGELRATRLAANVGKVFAVLFGLWGFWTLNMLLLAIAFFVYIGAENEARAVLMRHVLGELRVRDLMTPEVFSVPADITVDEAAERMLRERRLAYAAESDGQVLGLITLDAVQKVPKERRSETLAREVATAAPTLSPDDEVGDALRLLNDTDLPQIAVLDDGHIAGSIGRDEISRGLKLSELELSQRGNGSAALAARKERGPSYPPPRHAR